MIWGALRRTAISEWIGMALACALLGVASLLIPSGVKLPGWVVLLVCLSAIVVVYRWLFRVRLR